MTTPIFLSCLALLLSAPGEPEAPAVADFEKVCFDEFREPQEFPGKAEVERFLKPVDGLPHDLQETAQDGRTVTNITGLFRLSEPWAAESALRVSLVTRNPRAVPLRLFFWNGKQGVLASCHETTREADAMLGEWSVYGAGRTEGQTKPQWLDLWATDEGRYARLMAGTFTIHYEKGRLAATRANVLLWSVPFANPPTEVYLDAAATVRGLKFFRCRGVPLPAAGLPVVTQIDKPATLDWQQLAEKETPRGAKDKGRNPTQAGKLEKLEDGRVRLSMAGKSNLVEATAAVGPDGLHQYVFEVEDASPGSGVMLANVHGDALARLGFSGTPDGQLVMGVQELRGREAKKYYAPVDKQAAPFVGHRHWVRLLLGAGMFRVWTSPDGLTWSLVPELVGHLPGACHRIGLYLGPEVRPRSITLRQVQVCRFELLDSLVPEALFQRARTADEWDNIYRWTAVAEKNRPDDVAESAWLRACTLRTLAEGCLGELGQMLVMRLAEDWVAEPGDVELQCRRVGELLPLLDATSVNHYKLPRIFEQIGRALIDQRDPKAFTHMQQAMVSLPFLQAEELPLYLSPVLRFELLLAVYENRWSDVADLCRRVQYFMRMRAYDGWLVAGDAQLAFLLEWAASLAAANLPSSSADVAAKPALELMLPAAALARAGMKNPALAARRAALLWKLRKTGRHLPVNTAHPLLEHFDRETYSSAVDFQTALGEHAYREASQFITRAPPALGERLFPSADDPQWRTSLPVTFEMALDESPELLRTLQQEFGPLGELRAKQAIAAGDAAAVKTVALAFPRTEAAALAYRWLGDRELSGGHLPQATGHFQEALHSAAAETRGDLTARLRLAGALAGLDLGEPATQAVHFGEHDLAPVQFEQLVADLLRARAPATRADVVQPAENYRAKAWGTLPLPWEPRANGESSSELGYLPRATAVTFTSQSMILNSPGRAVAFNLSDGRTRWTQSASAGDESLRGPQIAYQPVVAGTRLLLRRLRPNGLELACLDPADGRVLWTTTGSFDVVSDPLWIGQELLALISESSTPGNLTVKLAKFDPQSGNLISRATLAEFHDLWKGMIPCRATAVADRIVASLGGCVLCCNTAGRVQWLRLQTYFTRIAELGSYGYLPFPYRQIHTPPLVQNGRVYVTQPGVWAVECLDFLTGRLLWRHAEPELRQVVAMDGKRLVIETSRGIATLDPATGKPLWHYQDKTSIERIDVSAIVTPAGIVYCNSHWHYSAPGIVPALVWLEADTGKVRYAAPVALDAVSHSPKSLLGPLFLQGSRIWAPLVTAGGSPELQIVELTAGK
jgi:outer membrane protein assembly factor BamB